MTRSRRATTGTVRGVFALAVLVVVFAVASLFVGVTGLAPQHLLDPTDAQVTAFLISRVPRTITIMLAGSSIAVAGLLMQHLTRNRFVSPSTTGTNEFATLGILVGALLFSGESLLARMVVAIVAAIAGTFLFLAILERIRSPDIAIVPLVGIMLGGVVTSVTVFIAYQLDLMQMLETWTTGSFAKILQGRYEPIWVVVAAGAAAFLFADRFTVTGMGREFATNLGVRYRFTLNVGLVIAATVTAVVVVVVGVVPFLGLVVPNIVSILFGDNMRHVLPVTALAGAAFLLPCDIAARLVIYPYEVPVGSVGGVIGAALFIWLILRSRQVRA